MGAKRRRPVEIPTAQLPTTEIEEAKDMKITMTATAAGPQGVARPNTVLDLPEAEAKQMVAQKWARPFDQSRDARAARGFQKKSDKAE